MRPGKVMTAQMLPEYQCHKVVRAAKIRDVEGFKDGSGILYMDHPDEGRVMTPVGIEYMSKHKPQAGGYFVVYEDDYQSWSPAEAFEEGYTRK